MGEVFNPAEFAYLVDANNNQVEEETSGKNIFTVSEKGEILTDRDALVAVYKRAGMLIDELRMVNLKLAVADESLRKLAGESIADQLNFMVMERRNMLDPYYALLFYQELFAYYSKFEKFLFFDGEKSFFDLDDQEFIQLRDRITLVFNFLRSNKRGQRLLFPAQFVANFFSAHRDLLNLPFDQIRQNLDLTLANLPLEDFRYKSDQEKAQENIVLLAKAESGKKPEKSV